MPDGRSRQGRVTTPTAREPDDATPSGKGRGRGGGGRMGRAVSPSEGSSSYAATADEGESNNDAAHSPYTMRVTGSFLISSVLCCAAASFAVGRTASEVWLSRQLAVAAATASSPLDSSPSAVAYSPVDVADGSFRRIVEVEFGPMPTKGRKGGGGAETCSSDEYGACEEDSEEEEEESSGDEEEDSSDDEEDSSDDSSDDDEDEKTHVASLHYNDPGTAQFLMMDVHNVVDPALLLSDPAAAIVDPIRRILEDDEGGGWETRSYHCHSVDAADTDTPALGHYCVGILSSAAHFAILTSPSTNSVKVTLQTSTRGSETMMRLVLKIKELFVPRTGDDVADEINNSMVRWVNRYRGWRKPDSTMRDAYGEDLGIPLDRLATHAVEIASAESLFQRIDIFDVVEPEHTNIESYRRGLSDDGSYESLHPELFRANRVVYLDGVMQSTSRGDESYHEALVHPAMFAHPNPKRVAIIGGGEGATLREVLKHDTVDHVKMIEIDEIMVKVSDEYLHERNDCTDIAGSHESCFKDERADVRFEDAMAWFINRFSNVSIGADTEELYLSEQMFDVVIMDALDPQDTVEFANVLYSSDAFVRSVKEGLTDDGVLVMQLGVTVGIGDPVEELSVDKNRAMITKMTASLFESVHIYEEAHCGFFDPWTYLVACKSYDCQKRWYANSAEVERSIHQRIRRSNSGKPLLKYFDGATQTSYQVPRKALEVTYCRSKPSPPECAYGTQYHQEYLHFSSDDFEVKVNEDGLTAVFAKVDIPKFSYIETGETWRVPPRASEFVDRAPSLFEASTVTNPLSAFLNEFGMESTVKGEYEWYVDPGLYSFMNHGCNGTSNVGHLASWTNKKTKPEQYFGSRHAIETPDGVANHEYFSVRSPVVDRHLTSYASGYLMSLRDIRAGDEITTNHLHRRSDGSKWDAIESEIDRRCSPSQQAPRESESS